MATKQSLYLVDGNAYIHRAYHALSHTANPLTNSKGEPTGALFGFATFLQKIVKEQKPDYMAICFDTPAPTFRHKAFEAYKAHRKEIDDALKFQLPIAREMAEAWGFPVVAIEGYEADDLIATLATRAEKDDLRVVIVTGDKDALQLVNKNVSVLNDSKNMLITEKEVQAKYGFRPDQLIDYFALTGDVSDNVPGVPGVGPVKAATILNAYGTLNKALTLPKGMKEDLREKLAAHKEKALLSRELVTLERDAPVTLKPLDCTRKPYDTKRLTELFQRFEFNSLFAEIQGEGATAPVGIKSDRRVRVVLAEKDLAALTKALGGAKEVAVDVETTGVDPLRCALVGISLSVAPGEGWYVPVGHSYLGCPKQLALKAVAKALGPVFADARVGKIGQNLKFDLLVLRRHGMPLEGIAFDTLLGSYCLNPSRMSHNLKDLARDTLGESMTPIDALIGKGAKQTTMDTVAVETVADYAGADAEVALRLKGKMEPLLREKKLERLYYDVELPLVRVLADMEEAGVGVDVPYLRRLRGEFTDDIAALEEALYALAGETLNLNSPKQLAVLLFEKLKLPVIRRTKTGYSTDEEVLRKLSPMHPLPAKLLEYRELSKLKSTYIDALLEILNPETGRVHTSFNQTVTATGRLSSSDPNLQNIPIRTDHGRRIRKAFVAAKGCVFLSADYSQIDLRVLAHVSGDPALREAFRRGEDIHAATAREIFGLKPGEAPSPDQRRVAKTVNFGIVYGQTAFGLSQQIGLSHGESQRTIDRYFARYAGVKRWIEEILEKARRDGYVTTLLNRIRYLPEIHAPNTAVRQFAERTAMNTPIQGTSADIIKVAMREVPRLLGEKKSRARMLVQVHDELLFEVPSKELEDVAPLARGAMESALRLDVPLVVDLKTGVNWAEMEKIESDK